jgi:hypothetical protein
MFKRGLERKRCLSAWRVGDLVYERFEVRRDVRSRGGRAIDR